MHDPPGKLKPNHKRYLQVLAGMTPEERLLKAFELSDMAKEAFRSGLRQRFPHLSEAEMQALFLKRLELCHNRNY